MNTKGRAYYNEIDPFAADWLGELIRAGHIAPGVVDTRSIEDVEPNDLAGFVQCHFFAGIGVWSYALRRAGWPDDRPVWTGSCPCQSFSTAGKGEGFADERHLWPAWFHLIDQCRPVEIFGEQVASKDGLAWLDLVQADLEGTDYACGAVDTCAAGFGAPHIRQRLYWVAHSLPTGWASWRPESGHGPAAGRGGVDRLDHAFCHGRREIGNDDGEHDREQLDATGQLVGLADSAISGGRAGFCHREQTEQRREIAADDSAAIWMGDADNYGLQSQSGGLALAEHGRREAGEPEIGRTDLTAGDDRA